MKKLCLLFILMLFSSICFAQETGRSQIRGEITVPEGFEAQGINIYNKTSGFGTTSSSTGAFRIGMSAGDSLFFSAIQFEPLKVLITEDIIKAGYLHVEIFEGLNELPEIIIRPHDLTGKLGEDIKNIEVDIPPALPPMSAIEKLPVEKASPRNAVVNGIGGGANHFLLLVKGFRALFPKKEKKKAPPKVQWTAREQVDLEKDLRATFEDAFFEETLGISVAEISSFVTFFSSKGFDQELLKDQNEILLIQFLVEQSESFREGQD